MKQIATGFGLAEAPVVSADGVLLVSDVMSGGIRRMDVDGNDLGTLLPRRRGVGGAALHAGGGVVVSGRDVAHLPPGAEEAVPLVTAAEGVTGFNDLGVSPDGDVLVGALRFRPFAGEPPEPAHLILLTVDGDTIRWDAGATRWPNGIAWSPDGSWAYVADFSTGDVLRSPWPVAEGRLEPWAASPSGQADGIAVDVEGNVHVALGGGAGVGRFAPCGELAEVVAVPAPFVSSVCFWPGSSLLVVTTGGSGDDGGVFVTDVGVAGAPVAEARCPVP